MAIICKKFKANYPDIRLLYYRDDRYSSRYSYYYSYAGIIAGNKLEAYSEFIDDYSEVIKASGLSLELGEPLGEVKQKANDLLRKRVLDSLFYNKADSLPDEWQDIFSIDDLNAIKNKNTIEKWHEVLSEKPEMIIKKMVAFLLHDNNSFFDFMESNEDWIKPSEKFVEGMFTKTDTSNLYAREMSHIYSNKAQMQTLLSLFYDWQNLCIDCQDPCSNISCWIGISKAVKGKKTVKAKIKDCDEMFDIPVKDICQNEQFNRIPFKISIFGPFGISASPCPYGMVPAMNHAAPLFKEDEIVPYNKLFYSFSILENLSYRNQAIWENPMGGKNP